MHSTGDDLRDALRQFLAEQCPFPQDPGPCIEALRASLGQILQAVPVQGDAVGALGRRAQAAADLHATLDLLRAERAKLG